MIYFTGLAEEILDHAINYYKRALIFVENIPCTDWKIAIDNNISEASMILHNLKETKEQEIDRVSKLILKKESKTL